MKIKCSICEVLKVGVGPKVIGQKLENDSRFNKLQQYVEVAYICDECLAKHKKGEINIRLKRVQNKN